MAGGHEAIGGQRLLPHEPGSVKGFNWRPVLGLAVLKLAMSLPFAGQYGWHQDELYYLASSHHLALGYIDYPPITPLIAWLIGLVFPNSLVALRASTELAGAGVVLLAALTARELGGRSRAQVLAALAVVISPMFIGANILFQTVSFDQLIWAAACLVAARLLRTRDPRLWPLLGAIFGLGLETKYTVAALALALAAGFVLTSFRRELLRPWPWLGAGIALVCWVPNLYWQVGHGWDSLAYTTGHRAHTDGPVAYWLQQLLLVQPLLIPMVGGGLVWLWRSSTFKALAWTTILVELLFFAAGGKSYYPAPIFALLYAAGAVWAEQALGTGRAWKIWTAASVIVSLVLLPIGFPILPTRVMAESQIWKARQDFADMYGWPELAAQVATVYDSLPETERRNTMVLAAFYGEAGALNLYQNDVPVVSPHLTYYYWAPSRMAPGTVVAVGYSGSDLAQWFGDVEPAGTITGSYGVTNGETGGRIYVCRSPKEQLWRLWPSMKNLA